MIAAKPSESFAPYKHKYTCINMYSNAYYGKWMQRYAHLSIHRIFSFVTG